MYSRLLLVIAFAASAACGHLPSAPPVLAAEPFEAALHAPVALAGISADGTVRTQLIGLADGNDVSANAAFRIASVTKTFVAATVLRLVETGVLKLDDRLADRIAPELDAILRGDGYATGEITLRQVLSHTAGLNDHAQSPDFVAVWLADPLTHWPRERHIEKLAAWTAPVGRPGERFAYSDSGYVLLGDVIERATGKPLAAAVRALVGLDALGLEATWWEQAEAARAQRAHQRLDGTDTYHWDATFDLYGGGGLVATVPDIARFFNALLSGKVFEKPETLALMLSAQGLPAESPYRLGIFEYDFAGHTAFGHAGFWGTLVAHEPATGRTFAASAWDRRDYARLREMAVAYFNATTH